MSEDGMLPPIFHRIHPVRRTPVQTTLVCGAAAVVMSGILPLTILTELISIGTLFAFIIVSAAVMVLRRKRPDLERPFKVPGGPIIPVAAIVVSVGIMLTLPFATWMRLAIWLLIGLVIYFTYSRMPAKEILAERIGRRLHRDPSGASQ